MADSSTPQDLSPASRAVLGAEDATDVIDDLRQRILTGDIGELEEAEDLLVEGLAGTSAAPAAEDDMAEVAEELSLHVWRECYRTAEQWEGEETDVDRLLNAYEVLIKQDISCGLFTDWPSMELSDEDRGGVLVWVNAWEDLSHVEERNLMIGYVGTSSPDEEVGRALFDALVGAGLRPQEPTDGSVTVPVVWRWEVEDPDDL